MRITRRAALRAGALGAAAVAAGAAPGRALAEADVAQETPLALGAYALNADWLFKPSAYAAGDEALGALESGDQVIALPHTVTSLSWSEWIDSSWEQVWIYRKHLSASAVSGGRAFVDFQGAMTSATVYLNGAELGVHQGGYLPFSVELTPYLVAGDNVLAVVVDGRLQNVPPNNAAAGDGSIDYLQPAGIYREVTLRIEPAVFVSDVFAKPVNVLSAPALEALVTVDAGVIPSGPVTVLAAVLDGTTVVGQAATEFTVTATGPTQQMVSVTGLQNLILWSPENPKLYGVEVTLGVPGEATQVYTTRTGFREAVFLPDGFHLNGALYPIFGLNRHQLFPYTGMAAPERVQRRDAEILRLELNCNMVRCSHYPQSDWFLDACDELGLMVWEEPPGWGYVNNTASSGPAFQGLVLQNVLDMVVRDRNRPAVIVWATRLNETSSVNNEALYAQTNLIAAQYDGTRQTTGAMNDYLVSDWNQQLFAYDDYTYTPGGDPDALDHSMTLKPPIEDANGNPLPYLVSESVGAIAGAPKYRFLDTSATLGLQAKLHAEAHSQAGAVGYAGLLGWCGFDYASIDGANINETSPPTSPTSRIWRNLKTPGVLDTFRAFKPGAAIYRAQLPAGAAPTIVPAFLWDFGSTNPNGPGADALVFTNCTSIAARVGSQTVPVSSEASAYPHLAHPPFRLDLSGVSAAGAPELSITGLDGSGNSLTTLTMSSDTAQDRLVLTLDDALAQIDADGTDTVRFIVRAVDAHGNQRPVPGGQISFTLSGTGASLVADNPFSFDVNGGVGGGFLRSTGAVGSVTLTATHETTAGGQQGLGTASVTLSAVPTTSPPAASGAGGPRSLNPEQVVAAPAPAAARAISTPPPPPPPAPSLKTVLRRMLLPAGPAARLTRVLRHGYTMTFHAPSAGRLIVGWYMTAELRTAGHPAHRRRRRVLVATTSVEVKRYGRARVHLRLTALGHMLLRSAHRAVIEAEASFTPKGKRRVHETRRFELRR